MDPTLFKVLSDANRLNIIEQLAQGEMCACRILKGLDITQPTLSHHMKTLQQCGLVIARKEGQCAQYSLNQEKLEELESFFRLLKGSAPSSEVQISPSDAESRVESDSERDHIVFFKPTNCIQSLFQKGLVMIRAGNFIQMDRS